MNTLSQGSVNSYDGFRLIVQKQLNLNAAVSHFYWIGSQVAGNIYQYRVVLPFDDKVINVATDADFNIEGELKFPVVNGIDGKTNFTVSQRS